VVAAVGIVLGVFLRSGSSLPGLQTGPAPWPPEEAHLRDRPRALGLPAQPSTAANLHHHDLLQIFVHGQPVQVPAQVGINNAAGFVTSIRTHDSSGIIHVESPTARTFTLGEFFDVWGVRFTGTCLVATAIQERTRSACS